MHFQNLPNKSIKLFLNIFSQFVYLLIGMVVAATLTAAQEPKGSVREKRGYHGHGHGHGHGMVNTNLKAVILAQPVVKVYF